MEPVATNAFGEASATRDARCQTRSLLSLWFLKIGGWHEYFWLSYVPMILLLIVGTKLEHIITQLTHEVAEKQSTTEGEMIIMPSDDFFWFHRTRILLFIIHLIFFLVAF